MRAKTLIFFLLCGALKAFAKEEGELSPLEEGNFSLPTSQQPGPLVGFGQNIVDQGTWQFIVFADAFLGKSVYSTDVLPGFLYGITDDLSIYFIAGFSPGNKDKDSHSSGLEDWALQLEYAYFSKSSQTTSDQATIVANIGFPTGSGSKDPPTGFGSYSYFIGGTYNHTRIDWLFFVSSGAYLTTAHHRTKFGYQFLYECGLGRNIATPCGWIIDWLLELDGIYYWKNRIRGKRDPDSGGNVIYLTPSIWASSSSFIFQFGVGVPIVQHWFGHQGKKYLSMDLQIAYTF